MLKNLAHYFYFLLILSTCHSELYLGCLHEDICGEEQLCYDDGLYGICLDDKSQEPIVKLDYEDILNIRSQIDYLNQEGFTWQDKTTQCRMMLLIYHSPMNCDHMNDSQSMSSSQIIIVFDKPILNSKEMLPFVYELFPNEDKNKIQNTISKDGKFLTIIFDSTSINMEVLKRKISYLLKSKKTYNIKEILVEDAEEIEKKSLIGKREASLNQSKSINKDNDYKSIVLFAVLFVACVVGLLGIGMFAFYYKRSPDIPISQEKRSSKIIRVKNKRLLPADSESHVEDDDHAVFEDINETIGNMAERTDNFSSDENKRNRSSSSGSSDPVMMNIDVKTGHLILRYMEEHFKDADNFNKDWNSIVNYAPENVELVNLEALKGSGIGKNRSGCILPYESSRVKLKSGEDDFINASYIFDHDPRKPDYIATISPLSTTVDDFWQMIWEQNAVTIVCLDSIKIITRINDTNHDSCVRYWPQDGTLNLRDFDIHLVSEHRSNLKYVIRSMYLKKKDLNETRTITQFHFHDVPSDEENLSEMVSALLEFRRKVNKSFRGMMSPVVIHSEDGCGMTGAYILIDMILSRIAKGIRELDMIASLEHLRDQKKDFVNKKALFKFATNAIAEEVNELIRSSSD